MSKVQVGDKIRLKKEMGPIKTIGSVCTVRLVKDNGDIEFEGPDIPGYGVMSEDELDKYFEIIDPTKQSFDENKNELGEIVQGFKNQLEKLDEIVTEVARKTIVTVPLRILNIGDVFTYKSRKYIVIKKLNNCLKVAVCPVKSINNIIDSMIFCNEDILVEILNDQK